MTGSPMQRIESHIVGVDQGDIVLFSDFEKDGDMWSGNGPREARASINFSESFRTVPTVRCWLTMWDVSNETIARMDVAAEAVTETGCELIFRTGSIRNSVYEA